MIQTPDITVRNDVTDYIPMGIMILRDDFTVLSWNKCLEQWTGICKEDIINQDIRKHFPHFAQPMYSSRLTTIFEGGPPAIFSSQLHKYIIPSKLPTGELRIQHTVVTAVETEGDSSLALFAVQDVSDFSKRMQDYFMVSKALKQSNEELESFTYSVSHDLKAPLRAINGFSGILEKKLKDRLNGEDMELLKIIRDSVDEINHLIEDLLALSRVGRKAIKSVEINMTELAEFVAQTQSKQDAALARVKFKIEKLPPCEGDPGLIRQIYTNLITNAVKFSIDETEPVIEIGSCTIAGDTVYTVADNGIGFDMQYVEKIFGVFQRLSRAEKFPGTGVGLAIVKRIVERHGGKVWAEGEVGKGAKIFFTLGKQAS